MMRKLVTTTQFRRDAKKHYMELVSFAWGEVLQKLLTDEELPEKYKDHQLKSNLKDFRDCHIKPDLVLMYRKYDDILELVRLGSHSDLGLTT